VQAGNAKGAAQYCGAGGLPYAFRIMTPDIEELTGLRDLRDFRRIQYQPVVFIGKLF
jgi:hypothetical protein